MNNLKCNQCNNPYDEYDKSKYLPCCRNSICSKCEMAIYREGACNKRFKCGISNIDNEIRMLKFGMF